MGDLPKIVQIPDTYETAVLKTWMREQWERHYPKVKLVRLDRSLTVVDQTYVEATARRFKPPIFIHAYVDFEVEQQKLTRYGIDNNRDVVFTFATVHLCDFGILEDQENFLVGDLIMFDSEYYEVKNQYRDKTGYWANTNIPQTISCACNNYRIGM